MSIFRPALRRTVLSLAVAGLAAMSVTACGDGSSDSAATAAAPAAKATAEVATGTAAVSAADLCDYLKKNLDEWKAVGSEVGAMAQMTMGLADLYNDKGAVPDGVDLDAKSKAQCPDVRTDVLKAAGINTFTAL